MELFIQALLIGLVAFLGPAEYMLGSSMLHRPIVLGPLVGIILGDPVQGVIIGGSLELAYIGIMQIGGAVPMSLLVGGVVSTAFAIMTGNGVEVATALTLPIGILYNLLEKIYYIVIQFFVTRADKAASEGNPRGIEINHYLGFACFGGCAFIATFIAILIGSSAVEALVNSIPQVIYNGLDAGVKLLPALGFGLLLNLIWNKKIAAFYFIGFVLAAYLNMDTMAVAILGGCVAILIFFFTSQSNETSQDGNSTQSQPKNSLITKKDLYRIFFRSLTLEASFNYERFQGFGYCYAMIPALEKLYPDKKDLSEALQRHMAFFNTSPQLVTLIMGISVAMEEEYAENRDMSPDSINAVKVAFMGPLAGVGDSLWWGIIRTIATGVACTFALQGNLLAPVIFLLIFNVPHILIRYNGLMLSYKFGKEFIRKLSQGNLLQNISQCASIMGLMVIGAMTVTMVTVTTPLTFTIGQMEPIVLQDLFDAILPSMLSLITVFCVSHLLKKGFKLMHLMVAMLVAGVLLTLVGIL